MLLTQSSFSAQPTLRDRKKADTWNKIRSAAREVFLEKGFRDTCLEAIAAHAGVGKATVYRHVESKAELYFAVLARELGDFHEEIRAAVASGDTSREKLESLGAWYIDFFSRPGYRLLAWAIDNQELIGDVPPPILESFKQAARRELERVEALIREGIEQGEFVECDAWVVANLLWKVGDGFVEFKASAPRTELLDRPTEEAYQQGFQVILRGLCRS